MDPTQVRPKRKLEFNGVRRSVVNYNHFIVSESLRENRVKRFANVRSSIVGRHYHADNWRGVHEVGSFLRGRAAETPISQPSNSMSDKPEVSSSRGSRRGLDSIEAKPISQVVA